MTRRLLRPSEMDTLLQFIARISVVLYILTAIGILLSLRGVFEARRRRRVAVFGLEREAAQAGFRSSMSALVTLSLLAFMVYIISNIVVPNLDSDVVEVTPTAPVVFLTQEPTPTEARLLYPTVTLTVGLPPAEAADQPTPETVSNGCDILGATITSPAPNDRVSGQVRVDGEANILDFGQYKFEVSGQATDGAWVVVGSYREARPTGLLGVWDSTSLPPGSYTLRLTVFREDGTYLTPCEVPIEIVRASGEGEADDQ